MSILTALFDQGKVYNFEQAFGVKDITSKAMKAAIKDWADLYYHTEATEQEDPCQRLPVAIVGKLTKTTFSEYAAAAVGTGTKADYVSAVLKALDKCRKKAMQQALLGGACFLKPVFGQAGLRLSVIARGSYLALGRDDQGQLNGIGTAERTVQGKNYYTLLERRRVDASGYLTIENKLYRSDREQDLGLQIPLDSLEKYAALVPIFTYQQPVHSLGLVPVTVPMENCVDGSQDPVSVYAPAAGLIHNINRNEAELNGEFDRGKSRIFVNETLMRPRPGGGKALTDSVFTAGPDDYQSGGITTFSPTLREQSYLARKTEYLRNVESLIGLKRGLLSEVEAVERTAKEITSSEGDYNLTIIDFQEMWEKAVREAVRVCDVLGRMYRVYAGPEVDPVKDITVSWGNGILYDEEKVWTDYKYLVAAGLLKPEIAVGWYFNMPTESPEDLQKVREKYMPEIEQLLDGGGGE